MSEVAVLRRIHLDNGLVLTIRDQSNRYYGDFHRLLLVVEGHVSPQTPLAAEICEELRRLGDLPLYRRELERMGVSSAQLEAAATELIDGFLATSVPYLERPDVLERLLQQRRKESGRRRSLARR